MWNEPNLRYFFKAGSQEQYFSIYRVTAETVKSVDPSFRVGGPATSNFRLVANADEDDKAQRREAAKSGGGNWQPIWGEEFLKFGGGHLSWVANPIGSSPGSAGEAVKV